MNDIENVLSVSLKAVVPQPPMTLDPKMIRLRPATEAHQWSRILAAVGAIAAVLLVVVLAVTLNRSPSTSSEKSPLGFPGSNLGLTDHPCQDAFQQDKVTVSPMQDHSLVITVYLSYLGTTPCEISPYGPTVNVVKPDGSDFGRFYDTDLIDMARRPTVRPGDKVSFHLTWAYACESNNTTNPVAGDYWMRTYLGLTPTNSADNPTDPGLIVPLGHVTPPPCPTAFHTGDFGMRFYGAKITHP